MEENYESLVDKDIRDLVAGMSPEQIASEIARLEAEGEEEKRRGIAERESLEIASKVKELTSQKIGVLTNLEKTTIDNLVRGGATPEKATQWVLDQRNIGLDVSDVNYAEVAKSQFLLPDSVYEEEAAKQLKNEFVNAAIMDNPELPTELIEELSHARSKEGARLLLRKFEQEQKDAIKNEANAYLLEQSQSFDLPLKLRARIAGLSVRNISEARAKVDSLIRNFKRG